MKDRNHKDGEPFYCTFCGSGYGEFVACEDVRCELETKDEAMKRASKVVTLPIVRVERF